MPENTKEIKIYRFGDMELNVHERLLLRGREKIALTPRMFDLLLKLVEADGHLLEKATLLDSVWADAIVEEGNLNRTISSLRKALGEVKGENRFIETVPKVGYRFVAEVSSNNGAVRLKKTETIALANDSSTLPGNSRRWKPFLAVLAFLLMFGLLIGSYSLFRFPPSDPNLTNTASLIRLTNNSFDEDAAIWGLDNRIRFIRFTGNNQVASYVIDANGANESRPETPIKDLRTGIWSPNGKKVAFTRENESGRNVYLSDTDGAKEIKLPFYPGSLTWSSDSTHFAYNTNFPADPGNSEIMVYSVESGKSSVVAGNPSFDANPSFSPDGKQIIFNSERDGNAEIYLVNIDGTALRRLTNHPAKEAFQVFSPDGTQIAFNSNRENEKVGIYLMNVNEDAPPVRISDAAFDAEIRPGCWSPDGSRIVFTSNRDGTNFNVYTMNVEPFSPRKLLSDANADLQFPANSPDGKRLAFSARMADSTGELRILDRQSEVVRTIAKTENSDLAISWSPDGAKLGFSCKLAGNTDICLITPDGAGLRNLTAHPSKDSSPAWSPDGRELIFSSNRDGNYEQFHLFRMYTDGTGTRRFSSRSGYELTPAWSADGGIVYFAGDRGGRNSALDIFTIDAADPSVERIVASRRFHDSSPTVSPDGHRIVFVAQSDGNDELYVVNSDGTGMLRLTRNPATDSNPHFSSDGQTIIFSSNRNGKFELFEIDLVKAIP